MAEKQKKIRLIFWLRAGFLTLIIIILFIGFFTSTAMRDGAQNIQRVVDDQKLLVTNMVKSKKKMDFIAGQMGKAREAVSVLSSMGMRNSTVMAQVGTRNRKNVENMQMIVSTIEEFIQQTEPLIRNLNDLEVLIKTAINEMYSIMGGYKDEIDGLQEQIDVLFTVTSRIKKRLTDESDQKDFEEILKLARVFAGIAEDFSDLFYEGAALNKVAETGEEGIEYVVQLKNSISALRIGIMSRSDAEMSKAVSFAREASKEAEGSLSLLNESLKVADRLQVDLNKVGETVVNSQNAVAGVAAEFTGYAKEAGEVEANNQVLLKISKQKLWVTIILALGLAPLIGLLVGFFTTRYLSKTLARVIELLGSASLQLIEHSQKISSSGDTLTQATTRQTDALTDTISVLETMSSTSKATAENTHQAKELSGLAQGLAGKGYDSLSKLTTSTEELNQHSLKISEIIKVIDEIAFKTNLLALNAAVEAARAGEHGRAFSVVADEVRNLAMRSAEAAKDTNSLIQDNMEKVGDMAKTAQEFGEMLKEIVTSINNASERITQIATMTQEQVEGIGQINSAVDQLDNASKQTLTNAKINSSISAALEAEITNVGQIIKQLNDLVGKRRDDAAVKMAALSHRSDSELSLSGPPVTGLQENQQIMTVKETESE